MPRIDALSLAAAQRADDAALVRALDGPRLSDGRDAGRWLLEQKHEKMRKSPFGFFRGALGFFDGAARAVSRTLDGAPGEGWIVGDAHAENFGALRADARAPWEKGEVRFWINDFDAVRQGRWVDDVLRLSTGALLVARQRSIDPRDALSFVDAIVEGYLAKAPRDEPRPAAKLLKKVSERTYEGFLAERASPRASVTGAPFEFVRGERYLTLVGATRRAIESVARAMNEHDPVFRAQGCAHFRVDDVAFRVAGNGSLGRFRAAIAVTPVEPAAPPWLYDLKELAARPRAMVRGRDALSAKDRHPELVTVGDRTLLLRPLAPQEDKLSIDKVDPDELESVFAYLGSILGAAHHDTSRRPRWNAAARHAIRDAAIALCGAHEAGYLGYFRDERPSR